MMTKTTLRNVPKMIDSGLESFVTDEPVPMDVPSSGHSQVEVEEPVSVDTDTDTASELNSTVSMDSSMEEKKNDGITIYSGDTVKVKYVRPLPDLAVPRLNELLLDMDNTQQRLYKFIDDYGRYSEESLLHFLDLEKRIVMVERLNEKGKLKQTRLKPEEIKGLQLADEINCRWVISSENNRPRYFPAIACKPVHVDLTDRSVQQVENITCLNPHEIYHVKNILKNMTHREEFVQDIKSEMRKIMRDGWAFNSVQSDGFTEPKPVALGIFENQLGSRKPVTLRSIYDEEGDTVKENVKNWVNSSFKYDIHGFEENLKKLNFPDPEMAQNKNFFESNEMLVTSEAERHDNENCHFKPNMHLEKLNTVWEDPLSALIQQYSE